MAKASYTSEQFHDEIISLVSKVAGAALAEGRAVSWDEAEKFLLLARRVFAEEIAADEDCFSIKTSEVKSVDPDVVEQLPEAHMEWGVLPWFDEADGEFELSAPTTPLSEIIIRQGGPLWLEETCERSVEDAIHAVSLSVEIAREKLAKLKAGGKTN